MHVINNSIECQPLSIALKIKNEVKMLRLEDLHMIDIIKYTTELHHRNRQDCK